MLEAVDQGYSVCAYSGELPAPVYRYWIDLQAAGPRNLEKRYDSIKEAEVTYPKQEAVKAIRNWYRDKFFLYDSYGTATDNTLFEVFEYAAQRYDCRVFLIDNLMTIDLSASDSNYYRQQSEFVNKIASFSQQYQVHVHLVAHPRKVQGRLTKIDISGSGDIANRANNVLSVYRLTENEKAERNCDTLLEIFKNRFYGVQDAEIELNFERLCRRFYMVSEAGPFKKYGWENDQAENLDVVYDDSEIPF
jgi:twinkle protein